MIIELLHSLTKFRSISIKSYFPINQEFIPDSLPFTHVFLIEESVAKIALTETSQREISLADILLIKYIAKSLLAVLAFLTLVKQDYK